MRLVNYKLEIFNRKVAEEVAKMQYQLSRLKDEGTPPFNTVKYEETDPFEGQVDESWKMNAPVYSSTSTTSSFSNSIELFRLHQQQMNQYHYNQQLILNNNPFSVNQNPFTGYNDPWAYQQMSYTTPISNNFAPTYYRRQTPFFPQQ
eukprot:TRINITY_DN416_c0_g1_i3.p1 TRINITY_DN416_c0_g1~~TRINITY_DN416_c0_g1_i3.p1  ORF type:complete len:147 (-),score=36.04 TRINITY_DN416_c0_g1_i3:186-626(-)